MADLAKQSEIILVVQPLNQGRNQDGIQCCPIIDTLCCTQQLNDMIGIFQLKQQFALHMQHSSHTMHALAANLQISC